MPDDSFLAIFQSQDPVSGKKESSVIELKLQ